MKQIFKRFFNNCKIQLTDSVNAVYLDRPWRPYAMTLFMNCHLPKGIKPIGWDNWRNPANEKTARFLEYNNTGKGAVSMGRATWTKQLTEKDISEFTVEKVLKGYDKWNPTTIKN